MNLRAFLTVFLLVLSNPAYCDNVLENLLSQILTNPILQSGPTEEPTTSAPIWNPLSWITPKALDIPYNPDSDLNTVSKILFDFKTLTFFRNLEHRKYKYRFPMFFFF